MNQNPTPAERLLDMVPAFCVLGVFLILALVILFRIRREDLAGPKAGRGLFLGGTLALAFLLAAVALFEGQAWAGDALKVLIGVFVGAGAAWAGRSEQPVIVQAPVGGGQGRPSERPRPAPTKPTPPLLDHEVHVVKNALNPLQEALNLTEAALREGWNLASVESGGHSFEGMLLVFTRPASGPRRLRLVIDGHVTEVGM